MFDLAWSEIALIGVVALVVIGPKDLPEAIRGVARGIQKLRRMAAEFQTHADELVREAKLDEVRNQINEVKSAVNEIRNFDLRTEIEKSVDGDGTIRKTFQDDPLKTDWSSPGGEPAITTPVPEAQGAAAGLDPAPPAFIPPDAVPPPLAPSVAPSVAPLASATEPAGPPSPGPAVAPPPAMPDALAAAAPLPPAMDPAPRPPTAGAAAPQPAPVAQKA